MIHSVGAKALRMTEHRSQDHSMRVLPAAGREVTLETEHCDCAYSRDLFLRNARCECPPQVTLYLEPGSPHLDLITVHFHDQYVIGFSMANPDTTNPDDNVRHMLQEGYTMNPSHTHNVYSNGGAIITFNGQELPAKSVTMIYEKSVEEIQAERDAERREVLVREQLEELEASMEIDEAEDGDVVIFYREVEDYSSDVDGATKEIKYAAVYADDKWFIAGSKAGNKSTSQFVAWLVENEVDGVTLVERS